jgi:hypothetical protein
MPEEKANGIKFFSEADMVSLKDKDICGSEYPAWYHDSMVDELRESIRVDEYNLERGNMPPDRRSTTKERINKHKERLNQIQSSLPDMADKQKDDINKVRIELGKEITRLMFSRSQMKNGLADAHMEAKRMVEPSIKLQSNMMEIAKACNVRIEDGKVSRKNAEKIWKICSKRLGEISNTEMLRKD